MEFLCPSEEHLSALKDFVVLRGGELDARVSFKRDAGNAEGAGLFSAGDVKRGDTLMKIPFHLCISVEKVLGSKLKVVCDENPGLVQYPDEIMALALMHGLDDADCEWHQHILTMPSTFNTPLYWSDEEVEMLKGSIVFHLTNMMKKRMVADFEALHGPLIQEYPELFPSANLEKYIWAMSVIYSRAIGIFRGGEYIRCIPPLMDMANHDPSHCGAGIEPLSYSEAGDFLYLVCSADSPPGSEIYVRYQAYPNSKLLYSYGFVLSDCPDKAIDLWPRVPPSAYRAADKDALLKSHALTAEQTYDFKGTIREHYVSPALLATCRVIKADEDDWSSVENAFRGEMVSVKNELAAYESLYGLVIARMQADKAQEERRELGEMRLDPNLDRSNRRFMALTMRVEERELLQECAVMIQEWIARLQEEGDAFRPSDSAAAPATQA